MALFGLKKDKPEKKSSKEENVLDMVKEPVAAKAIESKPEALKENTGRAHRVLQNHHMSEKTYQFAATGRYVFKVAPDANKIEVKKAIEAVYDVHVAKANIITVSGKNRRSGRISGRTKDWKKAIVTLKGDERIAGLAEGV